MKKPLAGSVALQTKQNVTTRVEPDLLEAMRATGKGWQSRVNDVLLSEFLKPRKAAPRS